MYKVERLRGKSNRNNEKLLEHVWQRFGFWKHLCCRRSLTQIPTKSLICLKWEQSISLAVESETEHVAEWIVFLAGGAARSLRWIVARQKTHGSLMEALIQYSTNISDYCQRKMVGNGPNEVVLQTNFNIILIMYLVLPRFLVAHTNKVAVLLHNFVVAFLFEIFQINIEIKWLWKLYFRAKISGCTHKVALLLHNYWAISFHVGELLSGNWLMPRPGQLSLLLVNYQGTGGNCEKLGVETLMFWNHTHTAEFLWIFRNSKA